MTNAQPISFRKVIAKLPLGEITGQIQYGWGCFPGRTLGWRGGQLNVTDEEFTDALRKELELRKYPVVGDPYALFGDSTVEKAEFIVAGLITKVENQLCFPFSGSPNANIGNTTAAKGATLMRVAWQIYSRSVSKVIYEVTTEGSYRSEETINGGFPIFLRNAFAANVRNLMADAGFHNLVSKNTTQPN